MPRRYADDDDFTYEQPEEEFADDSLEEDGEFEDDTSYHDEEEDREYSDENEFTDLDSVVEEGEEMIEGGEYSKAIEHFTRATEVFPESATAHFSLGVACYSQLRELMAEQEIWTDEAKCVEVYEQAISALEEALALEPDHKEALNLLGTLFQIRGNDEGAVNCWSKSLEIDGDQETVAADLAEARKRMELAD
jgi:Flp pilus assembly protein TadD